MAFSLPYFTPTELPPSLSPPPTLSTTALIPGSSAACQTSFFSLLAADFAPPTVTAPAGGLSAFLSPTDCAALAAIPSSASAEWAAYSQRAAEWLPRQQSDISTRLPQCPNFTNFMSRGAAYQTCTGATVVTTTTSGASSTITSPPTTPTGTGNFTLPTPTLSVSTTSTTPNSAGTLYASAGMAFCVAVAVSFAALV